MFLFVRITYIISFINFSQPVTISQNFFGLIHYKVAMSRFSNFAFHVNGQHTFILDQKVISAYSEKLKKLIRQEKRKAQISDSGIEIGDFPGGSEGFELVSRFCYNNGIVKITASNVSLLYCCAAFLGMTEKVKPGNLFQQTETFLEGMFYWSWNDILTSLKSCESCFSIAESYGLVDKLIYALLAKIAQNTEPNFLGSSSSSSSSPSSSAKTTPESRKQRSGKQWWFDDMTCLPPTIVQKLIENLGSYGSENNSLILTRFLLHYLKNNVQSKSGKPSSFKVYTRSEYASLADTAVHRVILVGNNAFSCRGLFSVLRIVSGFGLTKDCRAKLEKLIGEMLDQASLDDLLVAGHDKGVYDINLVLRLIRLFVNSSEVSVPKMKKVGRLVDKYLDEISPDPNLKIAKFLEVAESLPETARDCYDGVYRAIDIYLESHQSLSFEERSKLCRCLNYEKLTFEACKDLAKNPRIPPNVAVQALKSQQSKVSQYEFEYDGSPCSNTSHQMVLYNGVDTDDISKDNEALKMNIEKMKWRVKELEKACREMKGQMSRLVRENVPSTPFNSRTLPRLC